MKMKKIISVILLFALVICAVLSGCNLSLENEESDTESEIETVSTEENLSTRKAKITIIQYKNYTALNECCEGIKQILDRENVEYDVKVGSDTNPEADCEEFAQNIAINGGCDLIITIATPATSAVYPIISSSARTPVVFCAVTDPVGANFVESVQNPVNNCTGVATNFNITEQLNMINTFQPSITKLGVIYTKSEQSTEKQLKTLKKEAEKLGIQVLSIGVENPSDLTPAAAKMVPEVEAITLLPDNMIAENSWNIVNQAIIGNKPVYGVTLTQVKEGCLAGYCYDFVSLGKKTAETAMSVLRGQSAANTPVQMISECTLYVNKDMESDLEIEIPEEYSFAKEVITQYEN